MAKTPRAGDAMPRSMHSHTGKCTRIYTDGVQCGYPTTTYYSYNTPMLTICPVHGVLESDTKAYSMTTRRHQQWLAANYSEYAKLLNDADVERKQATGRVSKARFTGVGDAIA